MVRSEMMAVADSVELVESTHLADLRDSAQLTDSVELLESAHLADLTD